MPWNPTSWFVASRISAPDERPREYNDPSKQHELDSHYARSSKADWLKTIALLIPVLAIAALIAFIAFNLLSS